MSKVEKSILNKLDAVKLEDVSKHSVWMEEELGDLIHNYGIEIFLVNNCVYIKEEGQLYISVKLFEINGKNLDEIILTDLDSLDLKLVQRWLDLLRGLIYSILGDYEMIEDKYIEDVYKELYKLYSTTVRR